MGPPTTGEIPETDETYILRRIKAYQIALNYSQDPKDTQYIQRRINALNIALTYAQTNSYAYN